MKAWKLGIVEKTGHTPIDENRLFSAACRVETQ